MNKSIYDRSHSLSRPEQIDLNIEYIYYISWAKKAQMKRPIKIVIVDLDVEVGAVNGIYCEPVQKTRKSDRFLIANSLIEKCLFRLEDEQILNSLFCKGMLFYAPHQIKKKDQDFIDEFTEKNPELMI